MTDLTVTIDNQEFLDFACDVLRVPSPQNGEGPLSELFGDWLAARGMQVQWHDVLPGRPNIVAVSPGNPAYRSYLLTGHLDAPGPFGTWRHDPFDPWVEDGWLYGNGVSDMKGGLAATALAAAALSRIPPDRRGDVIFAGVIHHDTHGLGNKFFLATNERRIDAALSAVPTNMQVQLKIGGACIWQLRSKGNLRHISRPDEGINANETVMAILRRFEVSALSYEPDSDLPFLPRLLVGQISGGTAASVTAQQCVAVGDVRFPPGMTPAGIMADLQRQVDAVLAGRPEWRAQLRLVRYQLPYAVAADDPLVRQLVQVHTQVCGKPPGMSTGLPAGSFITDMADLQRWGIPVVLYGPGDWNTTPNEGVLVADLVTTAQVSAQLGAEIITSRRPPG